VTDACVGWDTTEEAIRKAHEELREPLARRSRAE
jgi:3-deoxy-D-arabino-heptulosonate 7-phosphate (DAHP) synthase